MDNRRRRCIIFGYWLLLLKFLQVWEPIVYFMFVGNEELVILPFVSTESSRAF